MDNSPRFLFTNFYTALIPPFLLSLIIEGIAGTFFKLPLPSPVFILLTAVLTLENFILQLYLLKRPSLPWRAMVLELLMLAVGLSLLSALLNALLGVPGTVMTFTSGALYAIIFTLQWVISRILFFRLKPGYDFASSFDHRKEEDSIISVKVTSSLNTAKRVLMFLLVILLTISFMIYHWNGELPLKVLLWSIIFFFAFLAARYLISRSQRNIQWMLYRQELPPPAPRLLLWPLLLLFCCGLAALLLAQVLPRIKMDGFKEILRQLFLKLGDKINADNTREPVQDLVMEEESPLFNDLIEVYEVSPAWRFLRSVLLALPLVVIGLLILSPIIRMLRKRSRRDFFRTTGRGWKEFLAHLKVFLGNIFVAPKVFETGGNIKRRRRLFPGLRKEQETRRALDSDYALLIHWGESRGIEHSPHLGPGEYADLLIKAVPEKKETLTKIKEALLKLFYGQHREDLPELHRLITGLK